MAKYSALKLAKDKIKKLESQIQKKDSVRDANYKTIKHLTDKVKKLTDDNTRLRVLLEDSRAVCRDLKAGNILLSKEIEDIQGTFDKQVSTLKLAGDTIRELQKSRKRRGNIIRILVLTLSTIITVGAFTL